MQVLRLLVTSEHRVVMVLTGTDQGEGAERGVTVGAVGRALGVPVRPAGLVRDPDFAAELRDRQVDVLLNVHSLYLIAAEVLAVPRVGSFNLHPGALPEYAGRNAPSWAVYHGETSHAVTLHRMVPQVDAGPIVFRADFPLGPTDTGLSVSAKCVQHGVPLIGTLLAALSGAASTVPTLPEIQQDRARRRYFGKAVPHAGWVPWQLCARQVVNFVRACDYGPWPSPWGVPRTLLSGTELAIVRAGVTGVPTTCPPGTVGVPDDAGVRVATADEWVVVQRLKIDGTSVSPAAVLQSGAILTAESY